MLFFGLRIGLWDPLSERKIARVMEKGGANIIEIWERINWHNFVKNKITKKFQVFPCLKKWL